MTDDDGNDVAPEQKIDFVMMRCMLDAPPLPIMINF